MKRKFLLLTMLCCIFCFTGCAPKEELQTPMPSNPPVYFSMTSEEFKSAFDSELSNSIFSFILYVERTEQIPFAGIEDIAPYLEKWEFGSDKKSELEQGIELVGTENDGVKFEFFCQNGKVYCIRISEDSKRKAIFSEKMDNFTYYGLAAAKVFGEDEGIFEGEYYNKLALKKGEKKSVKGAKSGVHFEYQRIEDTSTLTITPPDVQN